MQRAQAVASMCYFQNLQCYSGCCLVLLGLVSSGSHACYCFFMMVPSHNVLGLLSCYTLLFCHPGNLPLVYVVLFISSFLVILSLSCLFSMIYMYRSVPQIRPPFCNLSLSTKRREGLYTGCDDFSRDYAPPTSGTDKARPHCRWGMRAKREAGRCS